MPSAIAIFCDDVRKEEGNKISLMGIYGQDLLLATDFPVVIPKLCVAVWYSQALTEKVDDEVAIRIGFHGDKPMFEAAIEVKKMLADVRPTNGLGHEITAISNRFELVISPFSVKEPGTLEVLVTWNGGKIEAGSLEIKKT